MARSRATNTKVFFVLIVLWFLSSDWGLKLTSSLFSQLLSWGMAIGVFGPLKRENLQPEEEEEEKSLKKTTYSVISEYEREVILDKITSQCLPKLVCELYSSLSLKPDSLSVSELNLVSIIEATSLSSTSNPSKFHYAAHMGQLIRGVESNGCHNFFPGCPFSGEEVKKIARKIKM